MGTHNHVIIVLWIKDMSYFTLSFNPGVHMIHTAHNNFHEWSGMHKKNAHTRENAEEHLIQHSLLVLGHAQGQETEEFRETKMWKKEDGHGTDV